MSREAETRGHVTGAAGRLREARLGAITGADACATSSVSETFSVAVFRTPLAGMRPQRMLPVADKQRSNLHAGEGGDSMSREAETRGHVTGVAGRLREARSGAITEADGLALFAEHQTHIVGCYRTLSGHVTGAAGRLREARLGATTGADACATSSVSETFSVTVFRTPHGLVTGAADRSTLNYCALVTEARA